MKYLLIPFFAFLTMSLAAQTTSSVSYDNAYQSERVSEINKDLKKIDREIKHTQKSLKKQDSDKRIAERELQMLRERKANNREMYADVQASMRGLNLEALEDKIDLLEKDHRKLGRDNQRKAKAIARKKAQIQKLEQEIYVLEEGIDNNEDRMEMKMNEVNSTREIIVENALESKTDRLADLSKDYDKLNKEEEKLRMKIGKMEDDMFRKEAEIQSNKSQIQILNKEKENMDRAMKTSVKDMQSY